MFIAREKELNILKNKINSKSFEFGIVYGRRRIGKTRLLQEIVKGYNAIYFVANEMGVEFNLRQLSSTIASYYDEPITFESFDNIFAYLAKKSEIKQTILIIDEFTYLVASRKEIMSVIQNAVDQYLVKSNVKLILSGSHVGMVEDALSYKKPLYGRATFKMKIEPFDYFDAAKFYPKMSAEDKIILYSIFGGIPFYTEKIDDSISVKDNIINLIIESGAIFEDEISFFLSQEVRSVATYAKIIGAIASGATKLNDITSKSGNSNTGTVSKYLDLLMKLDIVEKEICFGENKNSKKTIYRVKDQLFRFHYYFIEKNNSQRIMMDADVFFEKIILPYLNEFVALEFENISREFLIRKKHNQILEIGRYWHNDARNRLDIEIDILLRTDQGLTAFECKWTKSKINSKVVQSLKEKVKFIEQTKLVKKSQLPVKLGFFSRSGFEENIASGVSLGETSELDTEAILQPNGEIATYNIEDFYEV